MLWADLEEAGLTLKVEDRWKRRAVRHVPEIYYILYIIYIYIYICQPQGPHAACASLAKAWISV